MTIDVTLTMALSAALLMFVAVHLHSRSDLPEVRSQVGRAIALAGASALTFAIVLTELTARTLLGG